MKTPLRLSLLLLSFVACADASSTEHVDSSVANQTECGADANHFLYMDDACKRKVQPSNRERTLTCPVVSTDSTGFTTAAGPRALDDTAFNGVVPWDPAHPIRVAGVVIRRIAGVPYYHYVSNTRHDEIVQPWSSSKFIAAMAAGVNLRAKSGWKVGLTASVDGYPLGDLVTDVASYENRIATSNGTARWFKNVAGRDLANYLVTGWLGRAGEDFRGGYGADLAGYSYDFVAPTGDRLHVDGDDRTGLNNQLSMFTLTEMMKRLVMWDDAATRVPELQAEDVQTLLYGAEHSQAYAGEAGGLMRDPAIYVQNALDMGDIEARSAGRWRIFSKLGYGEASREGLGYVGELVHTAYACLPVLDANGQAVPNEGAEFVLSVHASYANGPAGDVALNALYRRMVQEVMLPRAQPRP